MMMMLSVAVSKFLFRLLLVIQCYDTIVLVTAERRTYSGYWEQMPWMVHFSSGMVEAPGLNDLRSLLFSTPNHSPYPHAAHGSVADILVFFESQNTAGIVNAKVTTTTGQGGNTQGNDNADQYNWVELRFGQGLFGSLQWCCTEDVS